VGASDNQWAQDLYQQENESVGQYGQAASAAYDKWPVSDYHYHGYEQPHHNHGWTQPNYGGSGPYGPGHTGWSQPVQNYGGWSQPNHGGWSQPNWGGWSQPSW